MNSKIKSEGKNRSKSSNMKPDIEDAELISETKKNQKNFEKDSFLKELLNKRKNFLVLIILILFINLISFLFIFLFFDMKFYNMKENFELSIKDKVLKEIENSFEIKEISLNSEIRKVERNFSDLLKKLELKNNQKFRLEIEKINKQFLENSKNFNSSSNIQLQFEDSLSLLEQKINKDINNQKIFFQKEINNLKTKDDKLKSKNIIKNIEEYNSQLNFLRKNFKKLAIETIRLNNMNQTDDSNIEKLRNKINSLFVVRSLSYQNGENVDAILSRAEDHLKKGNISKSIIILNELPTEEKSLFVEWISMAKVFVINEKK
tara:strand:+ start:168 stop:1124 length:957 start_codon:yes stop_codon:yes gene_type:complete